MAALSSAVEGKPDVVLLDLGLPDVDGVDVLSMLRAVSDVPRHRRHRSRRRSRGRPGARPGRGRLRDQAVHRCPAERADPGGPAPKPAAATRTRSSRSAGCASTPAAARSRWTDARSSSPAKEFELLLSLARRAGEVVTKKDLPGRGVAACVGWFGSNRRRAPVVVAAKARRDRVRARVPAQRARGRRPAGGPERDGLIGRAPPHPAAGGRRHPRWWCSRSRSRSSC